ncbi:hypothetical protein J7M23_12390, partial [Candidatus Sumerlaeota bacterium]|nr:hypothetical protein [Candidatus Sumerlaeota bacterium]
LPALKSISPSLPAEREAIQEKPSPFSEQPELQPLAPLPQKTTTSPAEQPSLNLPSLLSITGRVSQLPQKELPSPPLISSEPSTPQTGEKSTSKIPGSLPALKPIQNQQMLEPLPTLIPEKTYQAPFTSTPSPTPVATTPQSSPLPPLSPFTTRSPAKEISVTPLPSPTPELP